MRQKLQILSQAFLTYLLDIRGYSPNTVTTYERALRQMREVSHFYEEDGRTVLDITPFRFQISHKHKRTISAVLCAIGSFVKYLETQQYLTVKLIGAEKIKVPQTLPKPIEAHYIEEVLNHANLEEQLLISMLYGLGLRISELSGLRLTDIKGAWVQIHGKGNKVRELPLLQGLQALIEAYITVKRPKEYLFEKKGLARNSAQLRYQLTTLFKASGLKVTPHQLRHSFATHLLNNGARISDISELLGHATMASTQVYTKLGSAKKMQEYMKAHPLNSTLS